MKHYNIPSFNASPSRGEKEICDQLASILNDYLPEVENKIWHRHSVWFLDDNPIAGYDKLLVGIRLMLWIGASYEDEELKTETGKFEDASRM